MSAFECDPLVEMRPSPDGMSHRPAEKKWWTKHANCQFIKTHFEKKIKKRWIVFGCCAPCDRIFGCITLSCCSPRSYSIETSGYSTWPSVLLILCKFAVHVYAQEDHIWSESKASWLHCAVLSCEHRRENNNKNRRNRLYRVFDCVRAWTVGGMYWALGLNWVTFVAAKFIYIFFIRLRFLFLRLCVLKRSIYVWKTFPFRESLLSPRPDPAVWRWIVIRCTGAERTNKHSIK